MGHMTQPICPKLRARTALGGLLVRQTNCQSSRIGYTMAVGSWKPGHNFSQAELFHRLENDPQFLPVNATLVRACAEGDGASTPPTDGQHPSQTDQVRVI